MARGRWTLSLSSTNIKYVALASLSPSQECWWFFHHHKVFWGCSPHHLRGLLVWYHYCLIRFVGGTKTNIFQVCWWDDRTPSSSPAAVTEFLSSHRDSVTVHILFGLCKQIWHFSPWYSAINVDRFLLCSLIFSHLHTLSSSYHTIQITLHEDIQRFTLCNGLVRLVMSSSRDLRMAP